MLAYREKNTTKNQMGDFKKTKWKEVLTVSLRTNLNSVTKVGDKLETLLKGKEIFFYQATIKREEEGELQALHSLATEQVPTTTRRKLNMEVLEKKCVLHMPSHREEGEKPQPGTKKLRIRRRRTKSCRRRESKTAAHGMGERMV